MNQTERMIERKCASRKERVVYIRQIYNRKISDYEDLEMPICEKCKANELLKGRRKA